jgi:hypothetical protein
MLPSAFHKESFSTVTENSLHNKQINVLLFETENNVRFFSLMLSKTEREISLKTTILSRSCD